MDYTRLAHGSPKRSNCADSAIDVMLSAVGINRGDIVSTTLDPEFDQLVGLVFNYLESVQDQGFQTSSSLLALELNHCEIHSLRRAPAFPEIFLGTDSRGH